jgi:hypothetical protein
MIVRTSKTSNIAMSQQNWSILFSTTMLQSYNASLHVFITLHLVNANGNKTIDFVLALSNYLSLYLEPMLNRLTILNTMESGMPIGIIGNVAQVNHQSPIIM